ncbi:hypothetical protein C7M84_010549, partial [Penaeus vannamei]
MKWLFVWAIAVGVLATSDARSDDDARVVAAYTTRTAIVLTTLTTTVPFTCANQFGTNVCQKRRYRRMVHIDKNLDAADDIDALLAGSKNAPDSLDDQEEARLKRELADADRDPRIALTNEVAFDNGDSSRDPCYLPRPQRRRRAGRGWLQHPDRNYPHDLSDHRPRDLRALPRRGHLSEATLSPLRRHPQLGRRAGRRSR